jgi:hypothetical protein
VFSVNLVPEFPGNMKRPESGYNAESCGSILQEGVLLLSVAVVLRNGVGVFFTSSEDHAASISRQRGIRGKKLPCVMTSSVLYSVHLLSLVQ